MPETKPKLCGDVYVPNQELPERAENDRYITPRLECEQAFAMLMKWQPLWCSLQPARSTTGQSRPPYILDPGAGPGIWGTVARDIWPEALIHGIEIQDQPRPRAYDRYDIGRFPGDHSVSGYDLVVGNPPFDQANLFVEESLKRLRQGGWLMFLLPLRYCTGSRRRDGIFQTHPLFLYAVYSRRISWRADGARKTPPRDHALFIWQKGYRGHSYMDLIGKQEDPSLQALLDSPEEPRKIGLIGRCVSDILTSEHIL
jgi:hypothetical protein